MHHVESIHWRHNGRDGVSNHHLNDCLVNRLFGRRSKKTSKLRTTRLCAGISPRTGEFPAHMASCAENVSIWWRYDVERCHISVAKEHRDPFYQQNLTLNTSSVSNYFNYKVWNEITYPFSKFNGSNVRKWISNFITNFTGPVITYPCWRCGLIYKTMPKKHPSWTILRMLPTPTPTTHPQPPTTHPQQSTPPPPQPPTPP